MTITVTVRNVYGKETVYPACSASQVFARIAGTTTLTPQTLALVKALGYTIVVAQPEVNL